jgi:hypothetical protein
MVRRYARGTTSTIENLRAADPRFVVADDFSDANDNTVLSFAQAQARVLAMRAGDSPTGASKIANKDYTVAHAMDDYFKWQEGKGKSADAITDARYRYEAALACGGEEPRPHRHPHGREALRASGAQFRGRRDPRGRADIQHQGGSAHHRNRLITARTISAGGLRT